MIEIEYVGNTVCYYNKCFFTKNTYRTPKKVICKDANVDLNIKKTSVLLNHSLS